MDAWLPQYSQDHRGHSLVVNRCEEFRPLWDEATASDEVRLQPISADSVIRSQAGQLHHKREVLSYRLHLAQRAGKPTPRKRVEPSADLSLADRLLVKLKLDARNKSLAIWREHRDPPLLQRVLWRANAQIKALRWWQRIQRAFYEGRVISALMKRIRHLVRKE
jgi:hypothetical protein